MFTAYLVYVDISFKEHVKKSKLGKAKTKSKFIRLFCMFYFIWNFF